MSSSSRSLRLSVLCLFSTLSLVCAAQQQFVSVPQVRATGGRVTSFVTGSLQYPPTLDDFLWINAPVGTSITAGELLNQSGAGFLNLPENQIAFTGVSNVVAAVADFDNDRFMDYAFALTPTVAGSPNLCVYYGTGATVTSGISSYSPGGTPNAYPPSGGKSGCMTFPVVGTSPPNFSYIAALPFATGLPPQLVIEDSANNFLYVFANNGAVGSNGTLPGFSLLHTYAIPANDGAGPIYIGDFNHDNVTDFILNGQKGLSASVYFGTGGGGFLAPTVPNRYVFDHNVHSMLMQDMDSDGNPDMVVEGDGGVIEIFHGNTDGTFNTTSIGGTPSGVNGLSGNGGQLAGIDPASLDILTTTPIGLSVLQPGNGSMLGYSLEGIYNIGPGRSSYAISNFFGSGQLDFAVDSAEGVAIVRADANGDGGFQTSNAYSTLAPALGATVGKFRNAANNPKGNLDVVAGTGPTEAQLLTGNGDGTFNVYPGTVNSLPLSPDIPATAWSNISSGDFDGDGNLDLLYSLTGGAPVQAPSPEILYTQYGNGDGTFNQTGSPFDHLGGLGPAWAFYYETAIGDFNGDSTSDLAFNATASDGVHNNCAGNRTFFCSGFTAANPAGSRFNQVATGFFKVNRTNKQDIVFQQGANFVPYLNSGNGTTFTPEPTITGPSAPYYATTVLLADVDGDGNGDLVVIYYNTAANAVGAGPLAPNQIYIWYGNGDGTFAATPEIIAPERNYYLGAVADMNGDGLPDLVLSDGSLVGILYNQGGRSFGSEQHYLAGEGINSLSVVDVNGDGEPDVVAANGGITISNPIVLGGETASSLTLTPNPDVNTGGITVLLDSITTKPVTGTLVATPEPSAFGTAFTLTATLQQSSPGVAQPTGTVQFYVDGAQVGSQVLITPGATSSTASYAVPAGTVYQAGVHPISATYSGDPLNSPIALSGTAGTHQITGGATTTELFLCIGPTPTCPSTGVISPPPPYVAALTMSYGQTWNGSTDVISNDGSALTGTVILNDAYTGPALPPVNPLCTLPVTGGACAAAVGTTLGTSVGVNVLTSSYSGDASHLPSTSPSVTITVLADTTTAALTGTPNPQAFGQPVTFTATLTGNAAPPAGPVSIFQVFANGTQTLLGTANLTPGTGNSSTATITTSTLPVGTDSIQAVYPPTMNFGAAASPVITETITPPIAGSFTLSVSPASTPVGVGEAGQITVTVTPLNGFSQSVNLTCSNLPYEAKCIFASPTITGGGGTSALLIQTTAPHSCDANQPYFTGSNSGGSGGSMRSATIALPALAGVLLLLVPGKRRWLRALVAVVIVAGATHLTGCGNCTDLGTRPNSYTITVTGTAATSSETQSQPVTITVTI